MSESKDASKIQESLERFRFFLHKSQEAYRKFTGNILVTLHPDWIRDGNVPLDKLMGYMEGYSKGRTCVFNSLDEEAIVMQLHAFLTASLYEVSRNLRDEKDFAFKCRECNHEDRFLIEDFLDYLEQLTKEYILEKIHMKRENK